MILPSDCKLKLKSSSDSTGVSPGYFSELRVHTRRSSPSVSIMNRSSTTRSSRQRVTWRHASEYKQILSTRDKFGRTDGIKVIASGRDGGRTYECLFESVRDIRPAHCFHSHQFSDVQLAKNPEDDIMWNVEQAHDLTCRHRLERHVLAR